MKDKTLKIGDVISYKEKHYKISRFYPVNKCDIVSIDDSKLQIINVSIHYIKRVPLNVDILVNAGFKGKSFESYDCFELDGVKIMINYLIGGFYIDNGACKIEYLHELQREYYEKTKQHLPL